MKLLLALLLVSFYVNSDALFIHKRLGSAKPGANDGRNVTNTNKQVSSVGQITGTNRGTEQSKKPSNGGKSDSVIDKIGNVKLAAKTQNDHLAQPTGKEGSQRPVRSVDNAGNVPGNKKVEKGQKPDMKIENGQKPVTKVENGQKPGKDGKEPRKDKSGSVLKPWHAKVDGNKLGNKKVENEQKPDNKIENGQKPVTKVENGQKPGKDGKEPRKDKSGNVLKPWHAKVDGNKLGNKKVENGQKPDNKIENGQKPDKKIENGQKPGKDGKERRKDKSGNVLKHWGANVDGNKLGNKKTENGRKLGKAGSERVTGNVGKDKVGKENSGKPKVENGKKPRKEDDVIIANEKSSNADKLGTKDLATKTKPNKPVRNPFERQPVPVVVN